MQGYSTGHFGGSTGAVGYSECTLWYLLRANLLYDSVDAIGIAGHSLELAAEDVVEVLERLGGIRNANGIRLVTAVQMASLTGGAQCVAGGTIYSCGYSRA